MKKAIFYQTARGEAPVLVFLKELDKATHAKVKRFMALLQEQGEQLHRPFVDHLQGPIKELRIRKGSDKIRILFAFFGKENIVFLHGIRKKKMEIPPSDIEKAMNRFHDFEAQVKRGDIAL